jgi:hypothetical protein
LRVAVAPKLNWGLSFDTAEVWLREIHFDLRQNGFPPSSFTDGASLGRGKKLSTLFLNANGVCLSNGKDHMARRDFADSFPIRHSDLLLDCPLATFREKKIAAPPQSRSELTACTTRFRAGLGNCR